jgi:5,10-methenyltetrahydrofolate synthetase
MENTEELSLYRSALRRRCLAAREALDADSHARLSAQVIHQLEPVLRAHAEALKQPPCVAFCLPMRGEIDLRPLLTTLLHSDWQAAVPAVLDRQQPMVYRRWTPDSALTPDAYGLPVPADDTRMAPTLVLLPLVAFDAAGYRLGYGGGCFDRTLAAQQPQPCAVGVGFELARVETIRPQAHDIRLSAVVTEAGVVYHAGSHPGRPPGSTF